MQKGDSVIANHPESGAREFVRTYGIVRAMTKSGGVIIELADGSLIERKFNSVAVFIKRPPNWLELFSRQQIVFSQSGKQMVIRRSAIKNSNLNNSMMQIGWNGSRS